jgi:Tol biopolymer transport system component
MQLYVMDLETRTITQLTDNKATNFAPFFLPDDSGILDKVIKP